MRNIKLWTDKETNYLKQLYEKGTTTKRLEEIFERSYDSIKAKLKRLERQGQVVVQDTFRSLPDDILNEKSLGPEKDNFLQKFLDVTKKSKKKHFTFQEISDLLQLPFTATKDFLVKHQEILNLKQLEDGHIIMMELSEKRKRLIRIKEPNKSFSIGVISDLHVGSSYFMDRELRDYFKLCEKEKIEKIFIGGDLVDGTGIYRGQEQEQNLIGFDNQKKKLFEVLPKDVFQLYFISGNHDEGFRKLVGMDPGKIFALERPDMTYLGMYQGGVMINDVRIELQHGSGGNAYALSYKGQKMIENTEPGEKPDILILGHYHTSLYFESRNIHLIQPGAFQGQSMLLKRLRISPIICGWIVTLHTDNDGSLRELDIKVRKYFTGAYRETE